MSGFDDLRDAAGVLQDALDMLDGIRPGTAAIVAAYMRGEGVFVNVDFHIDGLIDAGLVMRIEGVAFGRAQVSFEPDTE